VARRNANQPEFKAVYLEKVQRRAQAEAQGKPIQDIGALCLPQGMPGFWNGPYAFEIIQTPKQLNFYQEWNEQTRRIYMDGRAHPEDPDPSYNGHSIAHWEAAVLVVDTVAIGVGTPLFRDVRYRQRRDIEWNRD
jgi:hypothetical protein